MSLSLSENYQKLSEILAAGLMSTFGGVAAYVYQNVKNDKPFKFSTFLISAFLSFFAGNLVGSFIPATFEYRDGILMLAGFSAWPLLGLLEIKGKDIITNFIERRLGVSSSPSTSTMPGPSYDPSSGPVVMPTPIIPATMPVPMTKDE